MRLARFFGGSKPSKDTITMSGTDNTADIIEIADYLISGYARDVDGYSGPSRRLDVQTGGTVYVDVSALTPAGRTLALLGLEAWTLVTGITFSTNTVGRTATIRFDDESTGAYTNFTYDWNGILTSADITISKSWLTTYGSDPYSFTAETYIHEIGHALGLGHPGRYNFSATFPRDALFAQDSLQMTIMSYFDQVTNTNVNGTKATLVTPQRADIYAIQQLYGTAGDQRAGNTTYGENSTAGGAYDSFSAVNNDGNARQTIGMTVFDSGGSDTFDFRLDTRSQRLDLTPGAVSDVYGHRGTLAIALGTIIENAYAGSGDDTVIGNDAANVLRGNDGQDSISGGNGNDTIEGGIGMDTLLGGFGFDTIYGGAGYDWIDGGGQADFLHGDEGNDTIIGGQGFDVLSGGAGNDSLSGGTEEDWIFGGIDNDTIDGGDGNDFLYGGVGFDTIFGGTGNDYLNGEGNADYLSGGDGNDTLIGGQGFDVLSGNDGNDILDGGTEEDWLFGGFGNDSLLGGGGNDFLFGGVGFDTLRGGSGNDQINGEGNADSLFGDAGNDTLNGGQGVDRLEGGAGNDRLSGGSENDTLDGGTGNDVLIGGSGADVFIFAPGSGDDIIEDFSILTVGEYIDLSAYVEIVDFTALWAMIVDLGDASFIGLTSSDTITVFGVAPDEFTADHFQFA